MTVLIHQPKQIFSPARRRHFYGIKRKQKILPDRQVFSPLILTEPSSKLRKWRRRKKNCCLLKHRFTILTNKILCSTLALYVSEHRCCDYRRRSTTKQSLSSRGKFSQNFALNSPPKNKCRLAISHEQNNLFHLNLYYSGIIQIINSLLHS